MLSFFHSWRRIVGCITLVMALAVYGAWNRSATARDSITCYTWWKVTQSIVSSDSALSWERRDTSAVRSGEAPFWKRGPAGRKRRAPLQLVTIYSESLVSPSKLSQRLDDPDITWSWRGLGFGSATWPSEYSTLWVIPYWSIVLPLTLLSAYLILWKPREPD